MISVCMATYNCQKYVKEQIDSILKQIGIDDELIISDDNSTDRTLEIIKSIPDNRIRLLYHKAPTDSPTFIKATLNFENALKNAKGDYIFLSDQDDVWCDDKVKVMLDYFNKGYDYVVSDAYVTDGELNIISDTRFSATEPVHKNRFLAVFLPSPYQGSCAAFKKCVLEKAMPFPNGIQSHDRWIGNVAAFYFKHIIIPEKLIYYRRHSNVISKALGGQGSSSTVLQKIKYKLGYVKGLISIWNK